MRVREAVFLNGTSGSLVKGNLAWNNSQRGIMLRPTMSGVVPAGNEAVYDVLIDNPSGILGFGQPNDTLSGTFISRSGGSRGWCTDGCHANRAWPLRNA